MTMNGPTTRRPTIYDVAKRAGVSPSLVSLVLQNPAKVSDRRRAAVRTAMAELGYRPSRAATTLASSRTKSIGLVIDDYRNPWFVDLLRGMESALTEHGYHVMLADARPGEGGIEEVAGGFLAMHVDGLVIAAEPSESMVAGMAVPTVVAGWRDSVPAGADLISNDDDGGGGVAASHLLGLGHTRIGHLSGSGGAAAHRRAGFQNRIQEEGIESRIVGESGGTSEEDGYASASWLLDRYPETTAIFAANDTMALGALAAIKARGLSVPGDISLVGYDNSSLAKSRYLALTSVDNRSDLVGTGVARTLLARIQDPAIEPEHALIDPVLVVRSTTALAARRPL
ncbi:DNA-binding LacI/PurR family transcriptional regulator [Arthrobacter sp. UYNi723]